MSVYVCPRSIYTSAYIDISAVYVLSHCPPLKELVTHDFTIVIEFFLQFIGVLNAMIRYHSCSLRAYLINRHVSFVFSF